MESSISSSASLSTRLPAAVLAAATLYLLVATTTGFFWIDSWHDEQRATQLILLGVAAIGAGWLRCTGSGARLAPTVLWTLSFGVASSMLSGHATAALAEVALTGLLATMAATVALFPTGDGRSAVRAISRAALFIALAHGVGAVSRYAAALAVDQSFGAEIWLLGFSNPRVASSFYAMLVPFAALGTFSTVETDRRIRVIAWVALAAVWVTASGLEARALWLSYALAVPALLYLAQSTGTRRLGLVLVLGAVAGAAVQLALPLPAGPAEAAANGARDLTSLSSRDILWRLALDATLQHPVFGLGPGQFARLGSFVGAHPHNWILQLASEWGGLALALALAALLSVFRRLRSAPPEASPAAALRDASALAVLVALVSALVDGTLVMPTTQVLFALAFGLLIGTLPAPHPRRDRFAPPPITALRWASAPLIVGSALWLSAYAASTYATQEAERLAFRKQFPGKWLVPRFWENGLTLVVRTPSSPVQE